MAWRVGQTGPGPPCEFGTTQVGFALSGMVSGPPEAAMTWRTCAVTCLGVVSSSLATVVPAAGHGPDQDPDDQETVDNVAALPRPDVLAQESAEPIRLDGVLDEPVWQTPAATGFIQAEPREGQAATERTHVWVAHHDGNLYIAAHLFDSRPDNLVINDIRKDFDERSQDVFSVILDTFHDRRNGYVFMTNPAGARGDRQVASEGREVNASWDAIWRVETRRVEDGWTVEMEIPFRTIRSASATDVWGINFSRAIRRNNEIAFWAPIPRSYALTRLSLAGTLTGLPQTGTGGRDLRVTPYALANTVRETGGADFAEDLQAGVDVKWGVTRGLALDLTVNPDFAQVEADQQRVNLTQFSLFFPEKREFFLENSGIFYVGDAARNTRVNLQPRVDEDLLPFFSRRIGLTEDGRTTPINGGARLTGNAAGFQIGAMAMRTGDVEGTPGSDWGVLRVRKNVFRSSDIGGLFMIRRARAGGDQDFNRVYGGDAYIRFPGEIDWSIYYLRSDARSPPDEEENQPPPGTEERNGYTFRTSLNREGNFHHIKFGFMEMSPDFQDDLGFLRRTEFRKYFIDWGIRPRFEFMRRLGVRESHVHITWNYYDDLDNRILAKWLHSGITFFFNNGGNVQIQADPRFERIDEPFTIDSRIDPIPPGSYGWNAWSLTGSTDASRMFSFSWRGTLGGLWSGTQKSLTLGMNFKPSYAFRASLGMNRTDADLDIPDDSFVRTLWTVRTNYSFSRDMFIDALVQYDAAQNVFNSNLRFNLIHAPLSDLFIVWNEQRVTTGDGTPPGRSLTLKLTRMLSF